MTLVHVIYLAVSIASAILLGISHGRYRERQILLSPVILGTGERRLHDIEDRLRKERGAPRRHLDPENAPKQRKMLIRR